MQHKQIKKAITITAIISIIPITYLLNSMDNQLKEYTEQATTRNTDLQAQNIALIIQNKNLQKQLNQAQQAHLNTLNSELQKDYQWLANINNLKNKIK